MSKVKSTVNAKFNYGFSKVNLDFGNYVLYTCKIFVGMDANIPSFENYQITVRTVFVKKNCIEKLMYLIIYATMDYTLHIKMQKEIGKFLHKHAISKLDSKYAYAYDTINETYGDMELIIPSNTLNWDDIDISTLPTLH